jgi:orotate phosphoribosyltransferase
MKQKDLLDLLLSSQAIRFGNFKTKSGRMSPYFIDLGKINTGPLLARLSEFYADCIAKYFPETENCYGPAYKGIPLAVSVSIELSKKLKRSVSFTYNRKEAKDHGEGGVLVGAAYTGKEKVLILEDILTGGTSARESLEILASVKIKPQALVVALDREEKGTGSVSAREELEGKYSLPVVSLLKLSEMLRLLKENVELGSKWVTPEIWKAIDEYRGKYGA